MTGNKYQMLCLRTANTTEPMDLLMNGVLGLNGESGEAADMVKKFRFQGHELDREKLAKELGDIMWYVSITAHALDYSLDEIMQMNVDKLIERYPNGFESERSLNRSEYQEVTIIGRNTE